MASLLLSGGSAAGSLLFPQRRLLHSGFFEAIPSERFGFSKPSGEWTAWVFVTRVIVGDSDDQPISTSGSRGMGQGQPDLGLSRPLLHPTVRSAVYPHVSC